MCNLCLLGCKNKGAEMGEVYDIYISVEVPIQICGQKTILGQVT